jgi:hypothetical protein
MNEKIERVREYLLESKLPEDTKDNLSSLLDAAGEAANGSKDRSLDMAKAMEALAIHEVRQAIRMPGEFEKLLVRHQIACKGGQMQFEGKLGVFMAVVRSWPLMSALAVVSFSPYFPTFLKFLEDLRK